jgi:hypothetical protein
MKSLIESTSASSDTTYGTATNTTLKAIPFFHRLVYPLVLPSRSWVGTICAGTRGWREGYWSRSNICMEKRLL